MSANGHPTAEVVVALDELPPQRAVGVFDESQAQGFQISDAALNRRLRIAASICGHGSWSAPSGAMQIRQRQNTLTLQSFQQQAALVVFHPAIGPLPFQPFADRAGDLGDPESGIIGSGLAYEGQLVRREVAPRKGDGGEIVHETSEEWSYELLGTKSSTIGVGDKNSSVIRSKESLPC